jgi:GT2 family glycosyltransferase
MVDPAAPTLAIVIGTRNRRARLQDCLASLVGKVAAPHEIVVVDAGSSDGTQAYLQGLQGVRVVLDGQPLGQTRSLNRVFRTLTAAYICWLSDDHVVRERMLDLAMSILERNPDIGMVALKVKDVLGAKQCEAYIGAIWPSGILNCNQGMIRAALFRQLGFFDEEYQNYGLDPDLTTRVLLAGYKVVHTKDVAILHYRDRVASPGAIQAGERASGQAAAHRIYERKFRALMARRPWWKRVVRGGLWRGIVHPSYELARRLGLPLENWLGFAERDWTNLLYARHISPLDFIYNRDKPYYLVQSLRPAK